MTEISKTALLKWLNSEIKDESWIGYSAERAFRHVRNFVDGGMCRGCWDHDREVYKGSYGEDIGPFKPVKEERA